MILRQFLLAAAVSLGAATATLTLGAPAARGAGEGASQPVTAQLIWGTDRPTPPEQHLKAISPELDRRLRRIFKWKNYFEINRTNFVVTATKPAQVEMSRDCRLEVAQEVGGEVEIQLFGKGKLVVRKRQRIVPGETIVLAGDDKDDNAWFVIVAPQRATE